MFEFVVIYKVAFVLFVGIEIEIIDDRKVHCLFNTLAVQIKCILTLELILIVI